VKKITSICVALCLLGAVNAVGAQTITQGGPTGTLVSAFAANSGTYVPIYTTPAKGHFVLTELGGSNDSGCLAQVQGLPAGAIGSTTQPEAFSPGLLLPADAAISTVGSGTAFCYIIGVLEK
jgi:hypothetical protein